MTNTQQFSVIGIVIVLLYIMRLYDEFNHIFFIVVNNHLRCIYVKRR